jgi:hypothetical protein
MLFYSMNHTVKNQSHQEKTFKIISYNINNKR